MTPLGPTGPTVLADTRHHRDRQGSRRRRRSARPWPQATLSPRVPSLVGSKGGGAVAPPSNQAGPAGRPDRGRLDRLLAERGDHLLHAAMALTGNELDAEDLLQAAVERLLRRRRRVDDLEAYLRRILYNLAADGWRHA